LFLLSSSRKYKTNHTFWVLSISWPFSIGWTASHLSPPPSFPLPPFLFRLLCRPSPASTVSLLLTLCTLNPSCSALVHSLLIFSHFLPECRLFEINNRRRRCAVRQTSCSYAFCFLVQGAALFFFLRSTADPHIPAVFFLRSTPLIPLIFCLCHICFEGC
jgi:hypothetical protein